MKIPSRNASPKVWRRFIRRLIASLSKDPKTAHLVVPLVEQLGKLESAMANRGVQEDALDILAVDVQHAEAATEAVIRELWLAARAADGGVGGIRNGYLFPEGIPAETRPTADAQLARTRALVLRLGSPLVEIAELEVDWGPLLGSSVTALSRELGRRDDCQEVLKMARTRVRGHIDALRVLVIQTRAQVIAIYPTDVRRREALWPRILRRRRGPALQERDETEFDFEIVAEVEPDSATPEMPELPPGSDVA